MIDRTAFFSQYLKTLLWSEADTTPDDPDGTPEPLDSQGYTPEDIAAESMAEMAKDVHAFLDENAETIAVLEEEWDIAPEQVAHDFVLTRNGDGAGFWDGDYPEPYATELTNAAHAYGTQGLYIGDDRRIYVHS